MHATFPQRNSFYCDFFTTIVIHFWLTCWQNYSISLYDCTVIDYFNIFLLSLFPLKMNTVPIICTDGFEYTFKFRDQCIILFIRFAMLNLKFHILTLDSRLKSFLHHQKCPLEFKIYQNQNIMVLKTDVACLHIINKKNIEKSMES